MKNIYAIFIAIFIGMSVNAQNVTYCLKLTSLPSDGQTQTVKIEMQGNTNFKLGTSNLQFEFNTDAIVAPALESSEMAPPSYHVPTVTLPFENICSFNIELMGVGLGMNISSTPGWVEVGRVQFDVVNPNADLNLAWAYNGGTTQTVAYLDDEATFFYATSADCLVVEEVASIDEIDLIQELNVYPNPASKEVNIAYTIKDQALVVYSIYDAQSRLIEQGNLKPQMGQHNLIVGVEGYSAGQYIVTFEVNGKVITKRFDVMK